MDRFLDGELHPAERAHREAEVARDAALARRVTARRAFLAALGQARAAPGPEDVSSLEARVRRDLAHAGRWGARLRVLRLGLGLAAAAAVVLGLAVGLLGGRVDAMPPGARRAADLIRGEGAQRLEGAQGAGCAPQARTSPWRFPLVERQELSVRGCVDPSEGRGPTEAVLYRPEDLDVVGYVAVPDPGVEPSHDIGVTRLPDAVVFDVRLGGAVYYLAVAREFVERRGSCAACHGSSREGQRNPHRLFERRAP